MSNVEVKSNLEKVLNNIKDTKLKGQLELCNIKNGNKIVADSNILKEFIEKIREKDRDLRIGIVGQVKSGKSSLLNSVLFEGEDVLPKAATPMTAALTIMKYSQESKAEVEFFTSEDIKNIEDEYNEFNERLISIQNEIFENEKSKNKKGLSNNELKEKSKSSALHRIKSSDKHKDIAHKLSSYEQYVKILESGIDYKKLPKSEIISKNDIDTLIKKDLQEYIGAKGKYMPFTKSVNLSIAHKGLEGLAIIDTPGINDPVQSRGKRTYDELSSCDVILFVSNAGRFLDQADMEFLENVMIEKGTNNNRVYVIANKVDQQLHGHYRSVSDNDLDKALKLISENLNKEADNRYFVDKLDPELELEKKRKIKIEFYNPIIYTSGIAYSLFKKIEEIQNNGNLETAWNNLQKNYPKNFNNEDKNRSLQKLANINTIHSILEQCKIKKKKYLIEKIQEQEDATRSSLNFIINSMIKKLESQIADIKSGDLKKFEEDKLQIEKIKQPLSEYLRKYYLKCIEDRANSLVKVVNSKLEMLKNDRDRQTSAHKRTETETIERHEKVEKHIGYTVAKWLTLGAVKDYEWKTYYEYKDITTFSAENFKSSYRQIVEDIEYTLNDSIKDVISDNLIENEVRTLIKKSLTEKSNNWKFNDTEDAIQVVLSKIPTFKFSLDKSIPTSLNKAGTIRGADADIYIKNIKSEFINLNNKIVNQANQFIEEFQNTLSNIDISKIFVNELDNEIKNKIKLINDKENSIYLRTSILSSIKGISSRLGK